MSAPWLDGTLPPTLHICGVFPWRRVLRHCPICKKRTRMVQEVGTGYWSPTSICCRCGDSWCDGELMPRPFLKGWRKDSIANAKKIWIGAMPSKHADALQRQRDKDLMG